jgi:hypothetical protein
MEYAEANRIRSKSFGTLLGAHEGGLGSSLKAAISQKTQAKMTGMKEKFDPMNIAKFVTGGSNWAPALLGKLTGRKQSSIDYFSGVKRRGKGTAEKLGAVGSGGGDFLGILQNIESLLHTNRKEDKLKSEEENNFAEEKALEKARRHKELMEALTGKPYTKEVTTATKVDDQLQPSPGLGLLDLLGGASVLKDLGKILSFFAGGLGLALLTGVGLAAILLKLLYDDKNADETTKGILAAGDVGEANKQMMEVVENTSDIEKRKQNLLADRPSNKKSLLPWKDPELQQKYLTEIGFDEKTGLTASEKNQGFTGIDEKGKPVKKEIKSTTSPAETSTEVPAQSSTNAAAKTESSSTTPTPASTSTTVPSAETSQSTATSAVPVRTDPVASKALNNAQNENLDLNVPVSKPDPSTVAVNQSANISKGGKPRGNIPLVRNNEETIQRMIYNNTRVV